MKTRIEKNIFKLAARNLRKEVLGPTPNQQQQKGKPKFPGKCFKCRILGDKAQFRKWQARVHAIAPNEGEEECQDEYKEENTVAMINRTRTKGRRAYNGRTAIVVNGSVDGVQVEHMFVDSGSVCSPCS